MVLGMLRIVIKGWGEQQRILEIGLLLRLALIQPGCSDGNFRCQVSRFLDTRFRFIFPFFIPFLKLFILEAEWAESGKNFRIFLVFEGVSAAFEVYIDGKYVGYSQDSRLPCEFDITDFVRDQHVIAVRVLKWCDGSYLEVCIRS